MAEPGAVERETPAGRDDAPPRGRLSAFEAGLASVVEGVVAALVVAEVALLFAGVVARYVLHSPLTWSDELASILFLWLAMLGAATALRRGEHMRMTALVDRASPPVRPMFELVATAAALVFLLLLLAPACRYAAGEAFITTPALGIPNSWRAAALPVGTGLMAVFAFLRPFRTVGSRTALLTLLVAGAVVVGTAVPAPVLRDLGYLNLVLFFVGVVAACVFAGVPIAFAFGLATFGYIALATRVPTLIVVSRVDEGMSHLILLSVPLFVFLGLLIEMTGMARAMVRFLVGLFAPPFGVGYYAARAVGRVDPAQGIRPIWGYLAALVVCLAVVAAVPWISVGFLRPAKGALRGTTTRVCPARLTSSLRDSGADPAILPGACRPPNSCALPSTRPASARPTRS